MTEPKHLQHRVAMAFSARPAESYEDSGGAFTLSERDLPPIEPDLDEAAPEETSRHGVLRYWLVGGGLIVCALALAAGMDSSVTLLAVCAAAIGVASLLFSFAEKVETRLEKNFDEPVTPAMSPVVAAAADQDFAARGDLFASIHDSLGDLTVCRNLSGIILSANNTFRDVTGVRSPEGKTCEQLGLVFRPGATEHSYDVELRSGGQPRIYLWHDVITPDPLLGDLVVQSIARDVTAEREDALLREAARRSAEEDSLLKSRLIATVSHEIRTPLSGLLGMGHLLANTSLTAEQRNYLEGIRQSGTALAQLVEDLLDFSTLAAGRFQLRPRQEAVRPMIEGVVELIASRAHEKGVEIGAHIAPTIPEILVFDPARLRQVIYNVIGNAVKFTEKGGVFVAVDHVGGNLEIAVSDSGPGMNDAELKRIFGEFEQGDLSRAREGGVGLGLAISARIVAEAGGSLSVESKLGEGSTFTIRIPVKAEGLAMRSGHELSGAEILVLAPEGPASGALVRTLAGLGANVRSISDADGISDLAERAAAFTAVIVDHRLDALYCERLARHPVLATAKRIYLVNPESRPAKMSGTNYDSWLIRPLREQSLLDVLTGRFRGLEARPVANDDFPILAAEAEEPASLPSASKPEPKTGLNILVGEDDPVNGMLAQAALEKAGHHVRLATDFARLKACLSENRPDLVLTDFSMPDGTSETFIVALRQAEEDNLVASIPVIVLTADRSDDVRRRLLQAGADLVLLKPAPPDILIATVERLAGWQHQAA